MRRVPLSYFVRLFVVSVFLPTFLPTFLSTVIRADQVDSTSYEKLNKLNEEIDFQSAKLEDVYLIQSKLQGEVSILNKEMSILQAEESKLKKQLDVLFIEWQAANEKIAELDIRIETFKARSLERLRTLYMAQNNNSRGYLVRVSAIDRLPTIAYLLSKVEKYDRGIVKELSVLYKEQQVEEERYERTIREQKLVKAQIVQKTEVLSGKIGKKQSIVKMLETKHVEIERFLTKLRASALRLETVVASLTQEERVDSANDRDRESSRSLTPSNNESKSKDFLGIGLKKARGTLYRPVQGKVIRRFGKYKHSEFKDFVFSKGLLFSTTASSSVVAIAAGKVIYLGRLPGYGNMIILDHGKRSYSLYARLDRQKVQYKQIVEEGEEIGLSNSSDTDKGNFYFEIRMNGKPVDPTIYYGKL